MVTRTNAHFQVITWTFCAILTYSVFYMGAREDRIINSLQTVQTGGSIRRASTLLARHEKCPRGRIREEKFTMVIPTFKDKRVTFLEKILSRYIKWRNIHEILVVWTQPPLGIDRVVLAIANSSHDVRVRILKHEMDTLLSKFLIHPHIKTKGVFLNDDDKLYTEDDVNYAYSIWKERPEKLVGFIPRSHGTDKFGQYYYVYGGIASHTSYSMLLTPALFAHKRYFEQYMSQPRPVLDHIENFFNGEDIALNFLVASLCGEASGIHIVPLQGLQTIQNNVGLSSKRNHFFERNRCLNVFSKYYGMVLRYSSFHALRKINV